VTPRGAVLLVVALLLSVEAGDSVKKRLVKWLSRQPALASANYVLATFGVFVAFHLYCASGAGVVSLTV
jgi:hypothetical protein